jgi:hypothetical protein
MKYLPVPGPVRPLKNPKAQKKRKNTLFSTVFQIHYFT